MSTAHASLIDRLLRPVHRWIWLSAERRASKLFRFAETEADGGRDISRAAELTADPLLRRLYLRHAQDEQHHCELFRRRGRSLLEEVQPDAKKKKLELNWLSPGERGLDDFRVDSQRAESLLAFLHISEKAAAGRFVIYRDVLQPDPKTRAVFDDVLKDETFHMNYTYQQLVRVALRGHAWPLWRARLNRLWKGYLRLAVAVAGLIGSLILLVQYFVLLPPFVVLAKRAARREPVGWFKRNRPVNLPGQF
jgi:hypothetical protein